MLTEEAILKDLSLPAMPHVAARILQMVNSPNVRVEELQEAMISDQAITSKILMIANSAYFGLRRTIDTLSDAIFVLGFEAVKKIAVAVSTKEIYNFHGIIEQKLWEHAIGASIAAGLIASRQRAYEISAEECIVAGLLHDIGKAVMNQSQPERYAIVVETVYGEHQPFYRAELDLFGFTHQEVGALLFKKWKLPEELALVVGNHHRRHEIVKMPAVHALCTVIELANLICSRLGVGYRGPMPDAPENGKGEGAGDPLRDESVMEALEIGFEDLEEIFGEFKERYIAEKLSFID
jgi:putative nucleotidyltransferase with HDIG domain